MHSMWKHFDNHWMKPVFGGSSEDALFFSGAVEEEDEIVELMADRRNGGHHSSSSGSEGSGGGSSLDGIERGGSAGARGGSSTERRGLQEMRRVPPVPAPLPSRPGSKYTPPLGGEAGL